MFVFSYEDACGQAYVCVCVVNEGVFVFVCLIVNEGTTLVTGLTIPAIRLVLLYVGTPYTHTHIYIFIHIYTHTCMHRCQYPYKPLWVEGCGHNDMPDVWQYPSYDEDEFDTVFEYEEVRCA